MLWEALLDLVLPAPCAGCGRAGPVVCPDCGRGLRAAPVPAVPDPPPPGLPPCWAVTAYAGETRTLLLAYKERGRQGLAGPLGEALARAVTAACPQASPVLVPVPSRRAVARARGGDHVRRIAEIAAAQLRGQGRDGQVHPMLRVTRRVADSAGLGAEQRAANLRGALAADPGDALGPGVALVLVDDLVTTGATLAEAARALGAVGRPATAAAVIAATQRRPPEARRGG